MPISDPRDRFFYLHHTPMKDTYSLQCCPRVDNDLSAVPSVRNLPSKQPTFTCSLYPSGGEQSLSAGVIIKLGSFLSRAESRAGQLSLFAGLVQHLNSFYLPYTSVDSPLSCLSLRSEIHFKGTFALSRPRDYKKI